VHQHWAGAHAQEQARAEQSKQDGGSQNLGTGDIHDSRYYLPRKLSDKLGKVVEGCVIQQRAVEVVVLEVLTKGHPHVEDILRMPIVPVLGTEDKLVVLLLVIRLVKVIAVDESVIAVLVVDTHCWFLLVFLTSGLLR
jgi:hypothetical protein